MGVEVEKVDGLSEKVKGGGSVRYVVEMTAGKVCGAGCEGLKGREK